MQNIDILVIGDGLVDVFLMIDAKNEHIQKTEQGGEVCFIAGAKIPVDSFQYELGGNANNVTVGLSRLGFRSALITETGDDEFGQKIMKNLQHENVSIDFVKQVPNTPARFSINIMFLQDRTIFSCHVKRTYDLTFPDAASPWVYLTSVSQEWKPLYAKTLEYVKKHNAKLAFNPGSTQLEDGKDSFLDVLQVTDLLFVNKEEAERIVYGSENGGSRKNNINTLLEAIQKLGPKIVSITDGKSGSYTLDQSGLFHQQRILPGTFVQKTGVGDAYAAGFLGCLMQKGSNIKEAMLWGAANAASVIEHIGAQTGLLNREELQKGIQNVM